MVTIIFQQEVKNYESWKVAFDADDNFRATNGMLRHTVGQIAGKPNHMLVVSDWASMEAFQSFLQNPRQQENMKKAGTIGAPIVQVLDHSEFKSY
jgi:quinol monooxygenase YgiN